MEKKRVIKWVAGSFPGTGQNYKLELIVKDLSSCVLEAALQYVLEKNRQCKSKTRLKTKTETTVLESERVCAHMSARERTREREREREIEKVRKYGIFRKYKAL